MSVSPAGGDFSPDFEWPDARGDNVAARPFTFADLADLAIADAPGDSWGRDERQARADSPFGEDAGGIVNELKAIKEELVDHRHSFENKLEDLVEAVTELSAILLRLADRRDGEPSRA